MTIDGVREDRWEDQSANELAERWEVPEVRLYRTVGSTNDVARELSGEIPPGGIVLAEEQRRGRGRVGRAWSSPPGLGLWFSVVAPTNPAGVATLPIRVGLALSEALDPWTEPARVMVKWPNDLVLESRKLGGVLCEAAWAGDRLDHVIVGVGINLLHEKSDFPMELRSLATSLLVGGGGVQVRRLDVADAIVPAVGRAVAAGKGSLEDIVDALVTRDALLGKRIAVHEPETGRVLAQGEGRGIGPTGALIVGVEGDRMHVTSGTVRIVE